MKLLAKYLMYLSLSAIMLVILLACSSQTSSVDRSSTSSSSSTKTSSSSSTSTNKQVETTGSSSTVSSTSSSPSSSLADESSSQTQTSQSEENSQVLVPSQPALHPNYQAILNTYSKWINVLRSGGTFDDPTVEEGYLKNINPQASFYYALYDIDGNGQAELLLATGGEHMFVFSIWGNEAYPTRLVSSENVRVYVDIFENGLISSFFLDGYRPDSEGSIYRIAGDGSQVYTVGTFRLHTQTGLVTSDGPELLPDRSSAIQDSLNWQLFQ
ncbi:hypothetical protein [Streptococcus suis]|uniref:hypothetical protein n=1 Tax=Streptococcus suis TaxID=1307 RepID=UPI000CF680FD|nr:hypothetical protein [Streptococcus suis]